MRKRLLALLLLLPACLEYEIAVTTVVKSDGSVSRTLVIREKGEKKTWDRLERPAAPYATDGDDTTGYVAKAGLTAGSHPAGLRVKLGEKGAAEGTVSLEPVDLLVGTLYRYEERIAIGTDPARFRAELPRWTELGLRFTIETLRIAFPDIDFAPVEAKAHAELLPALERTILATYLAGQDLIAESRATGTLDEGVAAGLVRLAAREMAPLGVSVAVPDGPPWNDAELQAAAEKAGRQVAERLLAPLEEAQRAKVIDALFSESALDEAAEQARARLFPTEEARRKVAAEGAGFATSALGAYVVYGLFDSFHLRFRVELPGKVLRANGDLSRLPAVTWKLEQGDLILTPPLLFATSFEAREGAPGEGWDSETLDGIESALRKLTAEQRAALRDLVAKALRVGWLEDPLGIEGDEPREAYRVLREAVAALGPKAPPPSPK